MVQNESANSTANQKQQLQEILELFVAESKSNSQAVLHKAQIQAFLGHLQSLKPESVFFQQSLKLQVSAIVFGLCASDFGCFLELIINWGFCVENVFETWKHICRRV